MHFLSKPVNVTPQINHLRKMSPVLRVSTHIYGDSKEIDGKMFIFRVNLGMQPLKSIVSENGSLFWGYQHTWGFQGDRWDNVHFVSKPRHANPQIDCLRKLSPVLRISTHIYGVSKKIHQKTCIFWVNLGMWPLKSIVSKNWAPVLRVSTHIYGVSKKIDGKTFIFRVNLGMWPSNWLSWKMELCSEGFNTHLCGFQEDRRENIHFQSKPRHANPQIDCLGKSKPVLRVSTHIYGVSKKIHQKTCIFCINLGMWPLKSIVSENWALFWGFQHTFTGFPQR